MPHFRRWGDALLSPNRRGKDWAFKGGHGERGDHFLQRG